MWISETLTAVFGQISFITENRRTKTKFCIIYQSLWIKSVSPHGCRRPKADFCADAPSSPASRQWCWLRVGSCRLVPGLSLLHRPQRAVRAFPLKLEVARQLSVNTASTEIVTCLHGSSLGLCCPKAGCANAFCVAPTMRMGAQSLISRFFFALFLYPGHPLGPTVEIGTFFQIP